MCKEVLCLTVLGTQELTLSPLVKNLLIDIDDNSVQADIFAIVTIYDGDTVKYDINAEEPKTPAKREKGRPK